MLREARVHRGVDAVSRDVDHGERREPAAVVEHVDEVAAVAELLVRGVQVRSPDLETRQPPNGRSVDALHDAAHLRLERVVADAYAVVHEQGAHGVNAVANACRQVP